MIPKKGAEEGGGRYAAAAIAVVLMIALIFYVVAIPPGDRGKIIPGYGNIEEYHNVIIDTNPGDIRAPLPGEKETMELKLGDIEVDLVPTQKEQMLEENKFTILDKTLSKKTLEKEVIFDTNNLVSASLYFNIESQTGMGKINIKLNNTLIYSDSPRSNIRQVRVEIPLSAIVPGKSKLVLSAEKSGFTGSIEYTLSELKIVTYSFEKSIVDKEVPFTLDKDVVDHASNVKFNAEVSIIPNRVSQELGVYFNNKEIYRNTPAEKDKLKLNLPIADLKEENTLKFVISRGGGYKISNIRLAIDYSAADISNSKTYSFEITNYDWKRISEVNRWAYDCLLELHRVSGDNIIEILLNGNKIRQSFADNKINLDICKQDNSLFFLKDGKNTLELIADDAISLDSLRFSINSKKVEEQADGQ